MSPMAKSPRMCYLAELSGEVPNVIAHDAARGARGPDSWCGLSLVTNTEQEIWLN